jgi:hypothetical protein
MSRGPFVHEVELVLDESVDSAESGAVVTVALCGHWEHEGPCRWPHNNSTEASDSAANHRTLFVASAVDEDEVRERIERALRDGLGWVVLETRPRPVSPRERPLARKLATTLPS